MFGSPTTKSLMDIYGEYGKGVVGVSRVSPDVIHKYCSLKVEAVKETGTFLVSLLPLLFVIPTVGLMAYWDLIRADVFNIAILIVLTTILTFGVSGVLTKLFRKGGGENG